jgi:hypothetical protein
MTLPDEFWLDLDKGARLAGQVADAGSTRNQAFPTGPCNAAKTVQNVCQALRFTKARNALNAALLCRLKALQTVPRRSWSIEGHESDGRRPMAKLDGNAGFLKAFLACPKFAVKRKSGHPL